VYVEVTRYAHGQLDAYLGGDWLSSRAVVHEALRNDGA
jgi:hypothetical protein